MLLQRLKAFVVVTIPNTPPMVDLGFAYDNSDDPAYDGYSTNNGRLKIAQAMLSNTLVSKNVSLVETSDVVKVVDDDPVAAAGIKTADSEMEAKTFPPIPVVVYSSQAFINSLSDTMAVTATGQGYNTDNPNILGWMQIGQPDETFDPVLIVRNNSDALARIDKFFGPSVNYLRSQQSQS